MDQINKIYETRLCKANSAKLLAVMKCVLNTKLKLLNYEKNVSLMLSVCLLVTIYDMP